MSTTELDKMGPSDYMLVEWPGRQPTGEEAPYRVDPVERGIIRVLVLHDGQRRLAVHLPGRAEVLGFLLRISTARARSQATLLA